MTHTQLLQGLKFFGLDPREWVLKRVARECYVIHHRGDRKFSMTGVIRRRGSRVEWADLRLRSV